MQSILAALLAAVLQSTPVPLPQASGSPSPQPSATPGQLSVAPIVADHMYPGGTLQIAVSNSTGPIAVAIDNPIATWTIDQDAHAVTVSAGQTLGRAVLTISDASGQTVPVPLRIGVDAATIAAQNLTVQYTGSPVDPAWLQNAVQKAVLRKVQLQPGATAQTTFNLPALAPGSVSAFDAQVQVPGNDRYYPVNALVNVNLQNVAAAPFAPPLLFYDDDPEHIPAEGVLYKGRIAPGTPVRLYYYHDNGSAPRDLAVVFSTPSGSSSVQLIDASAGPNIDVMTVGHNVTRQFLARKPANEGLVQTVDAQTPLVAERFSMQPRDGVAGTIDVNVLSGGALDVTVLALDPKIPDAQIPSLLGQPQLPGDGHHRTGIFNVAGYARDALSYTVGGDDASLDYGLHSPPTVSPPEGRDFGEYGVWRTLDFTINNPGAQAATVYLYLEPMGGPVRSSFLVDGVPAELGCVRASERYQIGTPLSAPPGQSAHQLQTMTDGGSFYPVEVGLTATPPSPNPPPINAPNGCFPKVQAVPASSPSPQPEPTGTLTVGQ